jgi:hypothetical protein
MAPDHKPAGPGLVDPMQPVPAADQLAQRGQIAADTANVAHLAVAAGVGGGDVDTVLVHVSQTYRVLDSPMVRLLASSQRPGRPSVRCKGAALHALGVQPTVLPGRAT